MVTKVAPPTQQERDASAARTVAGHQHEWVFDLTTGRVACRECARRTTQTQATSPGQPATGDGGRAALPGPR